MTHISSPLEQTTVPAQRGAYRTLGVLAALASSSIVNLLIVFLFTLSLTAAIALGTLFGVFAIVGYACVAGGADSDADGARP